jgi:pyrimidine-nucleoside phosphorylase/thymidine phosphorylase
MVAALAPLELLERTRRGEPVDGESIGEFIRSWLDGGVGDAQVAAWAMAVCINGIDLAATHALTAAMVASGDRLELDKFGPTGDKHSTGGVGDAITLVVAPLAAALGVKVAKMSGRGLGHTGGTLDKLEAIPGMRVDLDLTAFVRQLRDVGLVVIGASERLVPADKRLYALRDQTGTVQSPALIASSIMSKKIAGGAKAIVLDIKVGSGAFFPDVESAREAARIMVALGEPWGRTVRYVISRMDEPLGHMVGNALEVRGAAEVLRGGGADDLRELAIRVAGVLGEAAGVVPAGEGPAAAADALGSGAALAVAERWVAAQGGDPAVWTDDRRLPAAPFTIEVPAAADGWVHRLDAREVGEAARWLGAGRLHPSQHVDPAVGVELRAKVGEAVSSGEPVAIVHCRDMALGERAVEMVAQACGIGDGPPEVPELVVEQSEGPVAGA